MGVIQSIDYRSRCIPISEAKPGESSIYRNEICFKDNGGELFTSFRNQPESKTVIDILRCSSVKYADNDCSGERVLNKDGTMGDYKYLSFKEFYQRCLAFGRGLLEQGLTKGDKIGIYSSNSQWWQTAAFGAFSIGAIVVPVYDSLGKDAAQYIVDHAEVKILLSSVYKFENAIKVAKQSKYVEKLLVMSNAIPSTSTEHDLCIKTCNEILDIGIESKLENVFAKPEDTAMIMYTSGSTGVPKGCVMTHANLVAGGSAFSVVGLGVNAPGEDTFLSFLPLAHVYGFIVELMMYAHGIKVGYAQGGVKTLMDDIQRLKPTMMIAVPRILNRVAEYMRNEVKKLPLPLQKIINWAIENKSEMTLANRGYSLLLDGILFSKFRAALGGRLRLVVNGGAPILPDVFKFLSATVTPCIIQGYGLTEVCAGLAVQQIPVTNYNSVGPSTISCDIKLRKVEGTDYDPQGEIPTGELLVRGPIVIKEYYKQPELTKDSFVDGWFATGDVVKIINGELQIIDRAKQLVKLSQGEYISLTTLSDIYSEADILSFIYIYADSHHDQPLGVVFPKQEKIKEWEARGILDFNESDVVKEEIIASLNKVFVERGLRGFERITNVIVEKEEPTIENGLLTPSMKPQFASFKRKYLDSLENLYSKIKQNATPKQ